MVIGCGVQSHLNLKTICINRLPRLEPGRASRAPERVGRERKSWAGIEADAGRRERS
jgi:hypothetical protein